MHKHVLSFYYYQKKHNILLNFQVLHRNYKGLYAALKMYINNPWEKIKCAYFHIQCSVSTVYKKIKSSKINVDGFILYLKV